MFVGSFLITLSIFVLVIGLFIFSISSWFSLGRLYLSKNFSVFCCLFYWCIVACSSLLWSFVFLWSQCNISFFIFNFIGLNPLPFFKIDESSLRFISFVYLPKELLVLLIFAIVFLFLFHLLYALVFMISFLLLILGSFIFLFLFPLDVRWVSLLGIFLIYWGKILFL